MFPRLLELGDAALTLEFGDRIDPELNARVMAARDALAADTFPGITDLVPTYRSLTVHFDPLRIDRAALVERLHAAAETMQKSALATNTNARHFEIPVRFGGEDGPDLDEVAATVGRSAAEIIDTLCSPSLELRVYLIGFLPGFPYMGELPEWLRLPRRATPRTAVPPNSVAIAGPQAAVYPWQSPGGWHLLGRTTVQMFDASNTARPALLAPGDTVRFVRV
jgi:KipI family sensor histidine kinase inhibitor